MLSLSFLSILIIIIPFLMTMTLISISHVSSFVTYNGMFSSPRNNKLYVSKTINTLSFPMFSYLSISRGQNVNDVMEDEVTIEDSKLDDDLEKNKVITKVKKDMKINAKKILKEEITALETTIRHKRCRISNLQSLMDHYSQAGFARKVVELDSLRNKLNLVHQCYENESMASVMKLFLPVLDHLLKLNKRYERERNYFAINGYGALATEIKNCFYRLGLEDSNIQIGSSVNKNLMNVLSVVENQSPEELKRHDSGYVTDVIQDGYKYKGNIIRLADVIVTKSLEVEPVSMKKTIKKEKQPIDESLDTM